MATAACPVGTLKSEIKAWEKRSLKNLDVAFLYLNAISLRVRASGRVTSLRVLVALAVLADGYKKLAGVISEQMRRAA